MKSSDRNIENSLRSYASRLQANNLDAHMILYSNNHLFECNPRSREIRPFNSVKWYSLESKGFDNILSVLEAIFDAIYPIIETENISTEIGSIINRTIAVEISSIIEKINEGSFNIYYNKNNKQNTIFITFYDIKDDTCDECHKLNNYLIELYDKWNNAMLFLLNNYDDIEDLF